MHSAIKEIAKMIDHSLLHPTMTDEALERECDVALKYDVATVCIKPYAVPLAAERLRGSDVKVCSVAGFPHGNSHTETIVSEAVRACREGALEIDMVSNTGKVLGGDWDYIGNEIRAVNDAVENEGAILKVIFENDFLQDEHIVRLCQVCSENAVAFVKTSTGYGFVKQEDGSYSYKGATKPHLRLMRQHSAPSVQVKAAGGLRTLDDVLCARELGASRIGATATAAILDEAERRLESGAGIAGFGNGLSGGGAY
jgi:deoxyribose-phosphate aldolase